MKAKSFQRYKYHKTSIKRLWCNLKPKSNCLIRNIAYLCRFLYLCLIAKDQSFYALPNLNRGTCQQLGHDAAELENSSWARSDLSFYSQLKPAILYTRVNDNPIYIINVKYVALHTKKIATWHYILLGKRFILKYYSITIIIIHSAEFEIHTPKYTLNHRKNSV